MESNQVFNELKSILEKYESDLVVVKDQGDNYYLNTPVAEKKKKGEFFGAVQVKKTYVAFHLMPIYYHPEMLDSISEDLTKRMQGKSCFNFNSIERNVFSELDALTKTAFDKYKELKKI